MDGIIDCEGLCFACEHLRIALAFYDAGRLETLLAKTGDTLYAGDSFLYCYYYDILDAIADFFRMDGDEDGCVSRFYFSDACVRDYFSLAREHAKREGIAVKQDPYYLHAARYYYDTMLSYCPYSCYFRLVTQLRHEFGCGLSVWTYDEQFTDLNALVCGLLDVIGYFERGAAALRKTLYPKAVTAIVPRAQKEAA